MAILSSFSNVLFSYCVGASSKFLQFGIGYTRVHNLLFLVKVKSVCSFLLMSDRSYEKKKKKQKNKTALLDISDT